MTTRFADLDLTGAFATDGMLAEDLATLPPVALPLVIPELLFVPASSPAMTITPPQPRRQTPPSGTEPGTLHDQTRKAGPGPWAPGPA